MTIAVPREISRRMAARSEQAFQWEWRAAGRINDDICFRELKRFNPYPAKCRSRYRLSGSPAAGAECALSNRPPHK
jgi:hypothetical protein